MLPVWQVCSSSGAAWTASGMKGLVILLLVASLPHLSVSGDAPEGDTTIEIRGFSHLLQCTAKEAQMAACLNGGKCAAIKLFTSRLKFCRCGTDYKGSRCEEVDFNIFAHASTQGLIIGLAVGLSLFVLILIVVIIVVVCCRKRRRRRQAQLNTVIGMNQGLEDSKTNGGPVESPPGKADKTSALPKDDGTGVRFPLNGNGKINNDDEGEDEVFLGSDEAQQAPLARPESYYGL